MCFLWQNWVEINTVSKILNMSISIEQYWIYLSVFPNIPYYTIFYVSTRMKLYRLAGSLSLTLTNHSLSGWFYESITFIFLKKGSHIHTEDTDKNTNINISFISGPGFRKSVHVSMACVVFFSFFFLACICM